MKRVVSAMRVKDEVARAINEQHDDRSPFVPAPPLLVPIKDLSWL